MAKQRGQSSLSEKINPRILGRQEKREKPLSREMEEQIGDIVKPLREDVASLRVEVSQLHETVGHMGRQFALQAQQRNLPAPQEEPKPIHVDSLEDHVMEESLRDEEISEMLEQSSRNLNLQFEGFELKSRTSVTEDDDGWNYEVIRPFTSEDVAYNKNQDIGFNKDGTTKKTVTAVKISRESDLNSLLSSTNTPFTEYPETPRRISKPNITGTNDLYDAWVKQSARKYIAQKVLRVMPHDEAKIYRQEMKKIKTLLDSKPDETPPQTLP